ncbi:hypothetical protein F4810DRAFT_707984 [Camillea tinctor]|nr:hypothetical protein F4810DRAFT_707984 [Camillea tinctor]
MSSPDGSPRHLNLLSLPQEVLIHILYLVVAKDNDNEPPFVPEREKSTTLARARPLYLNHIPRCDIHAKDWVALTRTCRSFHGLAPRIFYGGKTIHMTKRFCTDIFMDIVHYRRAPSDRNDILGWTRSIVFANVATLISDDLLFLPEFLDRFDQLRDCTIQFAAIPPGATGVPTTGSETETAESTIAELKRILRGLGLRERIEIKVDASRVPGGWDQCHRILEHHVYPDLRSLMVIPRREYLGQTQ